MYQKIIRFIKDMIFHHAVLSPDNTDWDVYVGGQQVCTINHSEIEPLKTATLKSFRAWLLLVKSILAWFLKAFWCAILITPFVCLIILWAAAHSLEAWPQFIAELMENSATVLRLINTSFHFSFVVSLCVWVVWSVMRKRRFIFSHPNPFMAELEDRIRLYKGITIHGVMDIPTKPFVIKCGPLGKAIQVSKKHN